MTIISGDGSPAVGSTIRERRLGAGLTLVELAERAGLSQPFLSQVENGRARPSMESLYRIASTLATTPQALFGGGQPAVEPTLARAHDPAVPQIETDGESLRRLLLPGDAPFHVVELAGLSVEYREPWQHDGLEAIYVLAGPVDVDLDGAITHLDTGDSLSYPTHLPHRYRSALGPAARVLLIEAQAASGGHGAHSAQP